MRLYGATPDGHLYRGQRAGNIDGVDTKMDRKLLRSRARRFNAAAELAEAEDLMLAGGSEDSSCCDV